MPSRILLIRHGRTAGNGHHYVGREDLPLDSVGVAQARAVAERLAGESLEAVFTSALTRTVQTALPLVAARPVPLYVRPELNEIDYGELQGTPKSEGKVALKREFRYRPMPGGESLHDVYVRVRRFAGELLDLAVDTVAVVGHYRSNQMLLAAIAGQTFEEALAGDYRPDNGSIYEVGDTGLTRRLCIPA